MLTIAIDPGDQLLNGHAAIVGVSPQIRAREDTSLDGAANGSAGGNGAPNVDARINGATHLGGQRCGDHEDGSDSTDYRSLPSIDRYLPSTLSTAFVLLLYALLNKLGAQTCKFRVRD